MALHRTCDGVVRRDFLKLGALPLGEGGGAKHSPPGDAGDKIW